MNGEVDIVGTDAVRVTHLIPTLEVGGAELVLARLLRSLDGSGFDSEVLCIGHLGSVGERLASDGHRVLAFGMDPRRPRFTVLRRLRQHLRRARPDVVQTWMYHADLLGSLLSPRGRGRPALVWGVHHTDLWADGIPRATRAIARVDARLSSWLPDRIVCCAASALREHVHRGYPRERMVLLTNGFAVPEVDPIGARTSLRHRLGLAPDALVVGRVGRVHPQKDHATLLRALADLVSSGVDVHLVLCGAGTDGADVQALVDTHGLGDRTHPLGIVTDMAQLHAGLDLAVSSSSFGEAFPGVIGEAMAVGVPVVTTDVGDSAAIVGATGGVVPPRDPGALADAMRGLLSDPDRRAVLGRRARRRISANFSHQHTVHGYASLYRELAAMRARGALR